MSILTRLTGIFHWVGVHGIEAWRQGVEAQGAPLVLMYFMWR